MSSPDAGTEVCERIGEAMPDIAGIGILVGFSAQAFISLVLSLCVFFLDRSGRLSVHHEEGTKEYASERNRLELVSDLLMVGNDVQMLTGTALIVTACAYVQSIDLYHLHLIFDTVSFVGISNCAAMVCWTFTAEKTAPTDAKYRSKRTGNIKFSHLSPRYRATYIFAMLFFALTIVLEVRLNDWSLTSEELGHCYRTTGVTIPPASHPSADKTYVAVTATWLLLVMIGTINVTPRFRKVLLVLSSLQFPLHMYMMIALRVANDNHLEGEESENGWDFGQTTATLLLGVTLQEVFGKARTYFRFERNLKRHGPEYAAEHEEERKVGKGIMSSLLIGTIIDEGRKLAKGVSRGRDEEEEIEGEDGRREAGGSIAKGQTEGVEARKNSH